MRPVQIDIPVLANDADGICASQTPAAGGEQSLTIAGALASGGVATTTNNTAQPVTITAVGNESARTFTVTGADPDGKSVSETVTGPNATTATTIGYFQTVTAVTVDDDTAGAITVGWVATDGMSTKSIPVNWRNTPFNGDLFFDLTAGTMTLSGQYTEDDPTNEYTNSYATDAKWRNVVGLTSVTSDDVSNIAFPVRAVRFIQVVGSATGTATVTFMQSN